MNTQPAYEIGTLPVWTFADKVRKARDIAELNQKTFAERLGITASSLAAYETGRSAPRFRDAPALARRLQMLTGIPADWFLVEDDPNGPQTKKAPTPKGEGQTEPPAGFEPATYSLQGAHSAIVTRLHPRTGPSTNDADAPLAPVTALRFA